MFTLHSSLQIAALENHNDEGEEEPNADSDGNTTEVPTSSSADNNTVSENHQKCLNIVYSYKLLFYSIQEDNGSKDISETDRCMQLDKAVKLSALKLQVQLTIGDISAF